MTETPLVPSASPALRLTRRAAFGFGAGGALLAAVLVALVARLPGTEGPWAQVFIWSTVLIILRELLVAGLRDRGHRQAAVVADAAALATVLAGEVRANDQVICLGAGDITKWAAGLAAAIEAQV